SRRKPWMTSPLPVSPRTSWRHSLTLVVTCPRVAMTRRWTAWRRHVATSQSRWPGARPSNPAMLASGSKEREPMSTERDQRVASIKTSLVELASELRDKSDLPLDRVTAIETEIAAKSAELDDIAAEQRQDEVEAKLSELDAKMAAWTRQSATSKASAILAGSTMGHSEPQKSVGRYNETNFLSALVAA